MKNNLNGLKNYQNKIKILFKIKIKQVCIQM